MKVEIGTEAAQFPEKEYMNQWDFRCSTASQINRGETLLATRQTHLKESETTLLLPGVSVEPFILGGRAGEGQDRLPGEGDRAVTSLVRPLKKVRPQSTVADPWNFSTDPDPRNFTSD